MSSRSVGFLWGGKFFVPASGFEFCVCHAVVPSLCLTVWVSLCACAYRSAG